MNQWLVDIIEEIQTCNDLSDIKCVLIKIRKHLGFSNVAYVVKIPETFTKSSLLLISDYPPEWLERYREQSYIDIDPVVSHCSNSQTPYLWRRFAKHSDDRILNFIGEASEFKLCDGISIGMPRFDSKTGLINLASDKIITLSPEQHRRIIACLNALQPCIHERICYVTESAGQNNKPFLTEREKTCLVWVAEGKTAQNIAAILAISEATVVFHLKNSIQKLNATNRSQAIAKAVLLGLITPQFSSNLVSTYHY